MSKKSEPTQCASCEGQFDAGDLTCRPDLMDPLSRLKDNDPKNYLCEHCLHLHEQKSQHQFVCIECGEDFNGVMMIQDAYGCVCIECFEKEGYEHPTLTPIPENGWKQSDIGRHVYVKGEHGVIIPDIIICSMLPHGKMVIGPGYIVGGIIARMRHMHQEAEVSHEIEQGMEAIRKFFEEGDDDDNNPFGGGHSGLIP